MHTLLDLRGPIPTLIEVSNIKVSDGKLHDVNILDAIVPEPASFYVRDRADVEFQRLHVLHRGGAFFVTRTKRGIHLRRRYSHPSEASSGVRSDHTVVLTAASSRQHYPDALRRIHYHDAQQGCSLRFLRNNFELPALTICRLYKSRWQVELFFKWIKQHLRIKKFYAYSENAVQTQIWIAVSRSTCWQPSSRSGWYGRPVFTKSYRCSASRCSSKCPFYRASVMPSPKINHTQFVNS